MTFTPDERARVRRVVDEWSITGDGSWRLVDLVARHLEDQPGASGASLRSPTMAIAGAEALLDGLVDRIEAAIFRS